MIYLDNAATALQRPESVERAVLEALRGFGNASRAGHGPALAAARTVYAARVLAAALFGCPRPERVVFTANATQALNTALCGLLREGDRVISTDLEHNSVLRPLARLERERGVGVDFVRADTRGNICCADFESLIRPRTRAIVCTHASNLTGNLLDLARIGEIAGRRGLLLIVDAAQTAGCVPIDMAALGIDVLCFTGHKGLMGPQGTGGLCAAEGVDIRPLLVGGTGTHSFDPAQPEAYPEHLEAGTLNAHGLAGLRAGLEFVRDTGVENIHARLLALTRRFYGAVSAVPGVTVYGDYAGDRAAVTALNIAGFDSAAAADLLARRYGIAVRAGAHCAPRMHEALGTRGTGAVRFSFGWFNTPEEIDAAAAAVAEMARS